MEVPKFSVSLRALCAHVDVDVDIDILDILEAALMGERGRGNAWKMEICIYKVNPFSNEVVVAYVD